MTSVNVPKARKLPSGSWFIQMRLGGESVPVTAATEKECVRAAELIKAEYRNGKREKALDGSKMTLGEAMDAYISKRDGLLSPSTIRAYKIMRKNRFQSTINMRLKDIKDWTSICNDEAKICAPKTLKNAWFFTASVIREATGLTPPKVTLPQVPDAERPFLEPDEILTFVGALKGKEVEIAALLGLHSLRVSEVCAIDCENINFERRSIAVKGAIVPNDKNELVEKDTNKNETSQRHVPMMIDRLYDMLLPYKGKTGKLITLSPKQIYSRINEVCRKCELPEVGTHGLRHSFASLAFHLGMPEQQAMEIGGWADSTTMHNIYVHLAKKDRLKHQNVMAEFFKNAN